MRLRLALPLQTSLASEKALIVLLPFQFSFVLLVRRVAMPRRTHEKQEEDDSTSKQQAMRSNDYPAVAGAPPAANPIREAELIALLREQQYRQAALAAAFPPSFAASLLAQREGVRHFADAPRVPAASFLAAGQPPPLAGISAATVLELARTRPDLLAMLQQPPLLLPAQPVPRPSVVVVNPGGSYPTTYELPPGKRAHGDEQEDTAGTEKLDKENKATEDKQREQGQEHQEQEGGPRPRKRVMFETAQRAALAEQQQQAQSSESGSNQEESTPDKDVWSADDHRHFVEAVFTMGMKHASPSVLLDSMNNAHEFPLTSERVKSRLQKYRNHGDKSKADFMQEFDTFLQRALHIGRQSATARLIPTSTLLQIMGLELPLYGGEAAALSTYEMLYQSKCPTRPGSSQGGQEGEFHATVHRFLTPDVLKRGSETLLDHCQQQTLEIPQLTEGEKASPLGSCFEHIMGTLQALTSQLEQQRGESNKQIPSDANKTTNVPVPTREGPPLSKPLQASQNVPPKAPGGIVLVDNAAAPVGGTMKAIENTGPKTTPSPKDSPETTATTLKTPPESKPEGKPEEKEGIEKLVAIMYQHKKGNQTIL